MSAGLISLQLLTYCISLSVVSLNAVTIRFKESDATLNAKFVRFDGDDVIIETDESIVVRLFVHSVDNSSLQQLRAMDADPDIETERARQSSAALTSPMRIFRLQNGSLVGPVEPLAFDNSVLLVKDGTKPVKFSMEKIHQRDLSEIKGQIFRQQNNLTQDKFVDDRLKQPVKPGEIIKGPVELETVWKNRLESLLTPPNYQWKRDRIDVKSTETVLAVSVDGRAVLVGPNVASSESSKELRRLDLLSGKSTTISTPYSMKSPLFLAHDNKSCVVGKQGVLSIIDIEQNQETWVSQNLGADPLLGAQSADGDAIVLALPNAKIVFLSTTQRKISTYQLPDTQALNADAVLWCSNSGDRIAIKVDDRVFVLKANRETLTIELDFATETTVKTPLLSLGTSKLLVGDPKGYIVSNIDVESGKMESTPITIGLRPIWLNYENRNGMPLLHVIGRPVSALARKSPHLVSIWMGYNQSLYYKAQSLEVEKYERILISRAGNTAVTLESGNWQVARETAQPVFPFDELRRVADDLVQSNRIDQIDAAYRLLRTPTFAALGSHADECADVFLRRVSGQTHVFEWRHGGDLETRGELLRQRWSKLMPDSISVSLIRACDAQLQAWRARGIGTADTVTEEGGKIFHARMLEVIDHVRPVLKMQDPPGLAFSLSYNAAKGLNLPVSVIEAIYKIQMNGQAKEHPEAHYEVVAYLLPRWHGKPGDSEKHIDKVADALGGAAGDAMYMRLIVEMSKMYPTDVPFIQFAKYDSKRLLRGLQAHYTRELSVEKLDRALMILAVDQNWDEYLAAMELKTKMRLFPYSVEASWIRNLGIIEKRASATAP